MTATPSLNGNGSHANVDRENFNGFGDACSDGDSPLPVHLELDAVIVGAGFAGVYLLHQLRAQGFKAKILEAGTDLGGVWHWNNYPGARVDTPYPVYALSIPEVYKTWQWSEHFPGAKELQAYFQHVDKILSIKQDVLFRTKVVAAAFDSSTNKWTVRAENGTTVTARWFNACMGFAAKRYVPDWPGLEKFEGYVCHSSFWPADGFNVKGRKVAVIGSGATGVQIAQETAKEAEKLVAFVRTANTCFPMRNAPIEPYVDDIARPNVGQVLEEERFQFHGGFLNEEPARFFADVSPEEREAIFEESWRLGCFHPVFTFADLLTNMECNAALYDFWKRKCRERMTDSVKRDILIPEVQQHPIFAKRPSLESDYYEQMDRPHVTVVDAKKTPISHFVDKGIVTADGTLHEVDVIALATGFDNLTGCFKQIDITGVDNQSLNDKWREGTFTYLGLTVSGFPNMFFTYGPQAPSAYANGPSMVELQANWIVKVMKRMRSQGKTRIDALKSYESAWRQEVMDEHSKSLRDKIQDSWYLGTNIPGKPREALNYHGGIPLYSEKINAAIQPDWKGFVVS